MGSPKSARRHWLERSERGVTLVEFALVAPLFFLLIMAIIDGGLLFKSYLGLRHATKEGARVVTTEASSVDSDYFMLQRIRQASGSLPEGAIEKVIVYKASSFDDFPSPACLNSQGQGGRCNVYVSQDFERGKEDFGPGTGFTADEKWPSWERNVQRSAPPDLVGVVIVAKVQTPLGVFGKKTFELSADTVMQLEARTQ